MQTTGQRYSVTLTGGDNGRNSGNRYETISDALDYAQTELTAGMEAIITDHEDSRPALIVRLA